MRARDSRKALKWVLVWFSGLILLEIAHCGCFISPASLNSNFRGWDQALEVRAHRRFCGDGQHITYLGIDHSKGGHSYQRQDVAIFRTLKKKHGWQVGTTRILLYTLG